MDHGLSVIGMLSAMAMSSTVASVIGQEPSASGGRTSPRRDHDGNGGGRDWNSLKAWAQAIGIVGIPGVIAIFLVYVGATEVPRLVRQQELILQRIEQQTDKHVELTELVAQLVRVTQRACYNAAKDDDSRQRCFDR